jgi:hypothetical protein
MPLKELIESVERAMLDARLRHIIIYSVACNYCLARAERLDGSYFRTFALELREQLADPHCICHDDSDRAAWVFRRGRACRAGSLPDHRSVAAGDVHT